MSNLRIGCLAASAFVISLALVFFVAVAFGLMRLPLTNIDRVVTQHSLAYVQAHQAAMLGYYADYVSGDAAHKQAATLQVCGQAALLIRDEWPAQVTPFILANCH